MPIAIVGTLVLGACGGGDDAGSTTTTAAGPPATAPATAAPGTTTGTTADRCTAERAGGALTIGVYSATKGLDPVVSTGSGTTGGSELTAIYDTLMRWNPETQAYEPRLAASLEPDAGFGTWTLTLRPDVFFGSGRPFTTAAVVANIERHKDPDNNSISRVYADLIDTMDVVDDLTMVFTLAKPWSEFAYVLADEVGMVPDPAVVDELGADAFNLAPAGAGAGPFEFASFAPGEDVVLTAKDDYWGGPVCIDELRFASSGTAGATFDSFETGQFDVAVLGDIDLIDQLRDRDVDMYTEPVGGVGILINNGVRGGTPPTADVRLRRAVTLALDPDALDERLYGGAGEPTSALFGPSSIYAGAPGPAADVAAAAALVDEVKADGAWDGKIRFSCQADTYADQRVAVTAALRAAGFDVVEENVATTGAQVQKVIVDADYELACWSLQLFDSATWVALDRSLRSDSIGNRAGYASPEMDAALDRLRIAGDLDARRDAIAEIQQVWNDTAPSLVLRASQYVVASADDVHGLQFNQEAMVYYDTAYIES